jgi:hypothetical protein
MMMMIEVATVPESMVGMNVDCDAVDMDVAKALGCFQLCCYRTPVVVRVVVRVVVEAVIEKRKEIRPQHPTAFLFLVGECLVRPS